PDQKFSSQMVVSPIYILHLLALITNRDQRAFMLLSLKKIHLVLSSANQKRKWVCMARKPYHSHLISASFLKNSCSVKKAKVIKLRWNLDVGRIGIAAQALGIAEAA